MTEPRFVHLRMHTEYSVTDGITRIDPAIHKVAKDGGVALGITDLMNVFGGLRFYTHAQAAGLKPVMGCDIKVKNSGFPDNPYRMALLCMNHTGYHSLCELLTRAFLSKDDEYRGQIEEVWFDEEGATEGLILLTGGPDGRLGRLISLGMEKTGPAELAQWAERFPGRLYVELQRAGRPNDESIVRFLANLAAEAKLPVVATHPIQFLKKEDFEAHEVRCCIAEGYTLSDPRREKRYSAEQYLKSEEEMCALFADIPSALANSVEIAKRCNLDGVLSKPQLPHFPTPEGMTLDDYMDHLAHEGLDKRLAFLYPDEKEREEKRPQYEERLQYELGIIKKMQFPGYFLIVQDFIRAAREELGVSVGPGRGSAAGSAVAYCLGITKIDPIKYDLLFERFLNPDRISLPDIDTDFDDDGRGEVLRWVTEKYGAERVAHIITYGTMATKSAIKDVARVQKLPLSESNRLAKLVPDKIPDMKKFKLGDAIKYVPELKEAANGNDPLARDTLKYAQMLEGNVRNTGVHACGVIIGRYDISDVVPVSTAKDKDTGEEMLVTQYEGSVIEETGLIKMDFLGLKTLSIIKEAIENVKLTTGHDLDIDHISLEDPKTYKLYCDGKTTGTFQFESAGMQKYLKELQPSKFEDLIAMNALYRPGPMDYIPSFIARKQGKEEIKYDIPVMERYLKDTYGITVYQEQVMLLSRLLANFTRGESDALRKAMGKKLIEKMNHLKSKFMAGGQANGYKEETLNKIWSDWEKFASYAFNKSHATCYSWVAYQTAYLKANFPSEYMAAVLSRSLSNITDITKFMDECKAMGIQVLGPDVNESILKFSVDKNKNIRFGLGAVKGVGESAVQNIIEERKKNGPYKSIFDFVERVNLTACNKKNIESMALAGAFDNFGIQREQFFTDSGKGELFLDTLVRYGNKYQMDKSTAVNSLFGGDALIAIAKPEIPQCERWSDLERLNKEKELVGIYLSAHPLDEYRIILKYVCNTGMVELNERETLQGREVLLGGIVTGFREGMTKNGKPYGILKIEDFTGSGEIPLFGQDYIEYSKYGKIGMYLLITARVEPSRWDPNKLDFKIGTVNLLQDEKDKLIEKISITVPIHDLDEPTINELSVLIKNNPGHSLLYFKVVDGEHNISLNLFSQNIRLNVTRELVDFLQENENIDFKING